MKKTSSIVFDDRASAGRQLLSRLNAYEGLPDLVVLSLPQGGIVVANEIARRLRAQLEITLISKLTTVNAGGDGDGTERHARRRTDAQASDPVFRYCMYSLIAKEKQDTTRRETLLRGGHPSQTLAGRPVLLVDDGSATCQELRLALKNARSQRPKALSVAVPVTSQETLKELDAQGTEIIYLVSTDSPFDAADHYRAFPAITDDKVRATLSNSRTETREHNDFTQSACG